jgi:hypothetical protein
MVLKKCRAFTVTAERPRDDENKVMILGACAVQVSLPCLSWMEMGTIRRCGGHGAGCIGTLRVCVSRD